MTSPAERAVFQPGNEFSLMPFWFWNDALHHPEIVRQIDDFERHGVHGFVIHPRVGLPRSCGWMSDALLGFMSTAIEEAARRGMKVILYDEGMYPSGSSCGQVVEHWPELACRCLALHEPGTALPDDANVIGEILSDGHQRMLVVDRKANSYIRGLHYHLDGSTEGPLEDEPPAGDILNPRTAEAIIELVYARFAARFGRHFGSTILGIFTDEPNPLGKCREKHVVPGTTGSLEHVSRLLGYDFRPHLASLWSGKPEAKIHRDAYHHAIRQRLDETWYRPLSDWCAGNGIALCGHPDTGDEIGVQRFFHIPGQDLVWRWVAPGQASALEGPEATQAKCSSSAMIHHGRRRNSNEFAGAYGAQTTFDEVRWLAHWCLVRGVNLLIPHAFYYSIQGPRKDERPPQIGPHTTQWETGEFRAFADQCRWLCWLNTDARHLCEVAVLTHGDRCPWRAAAELHRSQCDFNYIEPAILLSNNAMIDHDGVHIRGMHYRVLLIDGEAPLAPELAERLKPMLAAGRVVRCLNGSGDDSPAPNDVPAVRLDGLAETVRRLAPSLLRFACDSDALRTRTVEKNGHIYCLLFNESPAKPIKVHLGASPSPWEVITRPLIDTSITTDDQHVSEFVEIAGGSLLAIRMIRPVI